MKMPAPSRETMFALGEQPAPVPTALAKEMIAGGYTMIPQKYYNPNAARNALGLVAGNDVSIASGNLVDLESDLYGITRTASKAPTKQYQPSCPLGGVVTKPASLAPVNAVGALSGLGSSCPSWSRQLVFAERATGNVVTVDTTPRHLPTIQYVSYPGVPAPEPLNMEVYGAPWRF
jgi:hypothetical protein